MKPYRTAAVIGSILEITSVLNAYASRGTFTFGGELLILPAILLTVYVYRSSVKEENHNGK